MKIIKKIINSITGRKEMLSILGRLSVRQENEFLSIKAWQVIALAFPKLGLPVVTPWTMRPYTIVHILNEIRMHNRTRVVEFGAGLSTIIIASLLNKEFPGVRIVAIDHSEEWIRSIKDQCKKLGIIDSVEFLVRELVETRERFNGKPVFWYSESGLKSELQGRVFDLVIVDGPPAGNPEEPYNRFPAVPFLIKNKMLTETNFSIFLDDTKREGEQEILKLWSSYLSTAECKTFQDYGYLVSNPRFDTQFA
jgi:hypothetical protein